MSKSLEPEFESAKLAGGGDSDQIIKKAECSMQQLREERTQKENSVQLLLDQLSEMDRRKDYLNEELKKFHERIDASNCSEIVMELNKKLELLKVLEKQESDLQHDYGKEHSELPSKLELDKNACDSLQKLDLLKKELTAKLRAIFSLKRQFDDVPAQTELIQYERRFSELYAQIQEKHHQTRKQYMRYNALLEIKELMLKETSLLNSINSQFQDAMSSAAGRSKLLYSMEVIVKGTKQKLEKVQNTLIEEQSICESLKQKHATALAEQRHFSSLLKAFQEECIRNENLRKLTSI